MAIIDDMKHGTGDDAQSAARVGAHAVLVTVGRVRGGRVTCGGERDRFGEVGKERRWAVLPRIASRVCSALARAPRR